MRPLVVIDSHLRRWSVQFHPVTYFLDERFLLFQFRFEGINFFLLFLLIFKRLAEGWQIVHDHTSAAPPPK